MKIKLNKFLSNFLLIFLVIALTFEIYPQEMPVPSNLQAALFKKIFSFNKSIKGNPEVIVLSGDGSGEEIVAAFKDAGVNAKEVKGSQVPSGSSIVYVMPGVSSPKQFCSQQGILSISGVTAYVEDGKVSIGIGVEGGKPKIIIHLAQLKAEKQEVSAELLKIAKVIQ